MGDKHIRATFPNVAGLSDLGDSHIRKIKSDLRKEEDHFEGPPSKCSPAHPQGRHLPPAVVWLTGLLSRFVGR